MRVLVCVSALVPVLAAASPAQVCGPLTFAFAPTGPGCAPFGGGIAALAGGLGASTPGTCNVVFTVTAPSILGLQVPTILWLGATNPALNLAPSGFPGCTLLASPDVLLPLSTGGLPPDHTTTVPVAPNPVFVGTTVYAQALAIPAGLVGTLPTLSNGLAVSL